MCVKCVNGYCSEYDLFIRKTFHHTKTVESDYRKTDSIDVMPNQGRILINTIPDDDDWSSSSDESSESSIYSSGESHESDSE